MMGAGGIVASIVKGVTHFMPNATAKMNREHDIVEKTLDYRAKFMSKFLFAAAITPFILAMWIGILAVALLSFDVIDYAKFKMIMVLPEWLGIGNIFAIAFYIITKRIVDSKRNEARAEAIMHRLETTKKKQMEVKQIKAKDPSMSTAKCSINYGFVYDTLEGGILHKAYVPKDNNDNSGLTLGGGVDIGQLKHLDGLSDENLKAKLTPFLNVKGNKKVKALMTKLKPTFTKAEAIAITNFRGAITVAALKKCFQDAGDHFCLLPSRAQTIAYSRAHHQGDNLCSHSPRFFSHLTNRRWIKAVDELKDYWPDKAQAKLFRKRMKLEALYLAKVIDDDDD